jgi:hypothetical protein
MPKRDVNDILREEGVDAVRADFDRNLKLFVPDDEPNGLVPPIGVSPTGIHSKRSADELVLLAHKLFDVIEKAERKVNEKRVEAGRVLLELRQQIEADGLRWWSYYGEHFARSRSDAERLMAIASAENPAKALQDANSRNASHQRAFRERHRAASTPAYSKRESEVPTPAYSKMEPDALEPSSEPSPLQPEIYPPEPSAKKRPKQYPEAPEDAGLITEITERFRRLSWGGRVKAVQAINELYAGWQHTGGR